MISAISDYNDYYYEKQLAAASSATAVSKTDSGTAVEGLTTTASTQKKADTLELSATYVAQAATETDVTAEVVQAAPPPPPPPPAAEETDETDAILDALADILASLDDTEDSSAVEELTTATESDTIDLTSQSESDLKSLVEDGTITQQEMDTELARRAEETAAESTSDVSQTKTELTDAQKQGIQAYLKQAGYTTIAAENGTVLNIA